MTMRDERYLDNINFRSKNGVLTAEPDFDNSYVVGLLERCRAAEVLGYKGIADVLNDRMVDIEISYDLEKDKIELRLYLLNDLFEDEKMNDYFLFTEDYLSLDEREDFKDFLLSAEQIQKSEPEAER